MAEALSVGTFIAEVVAMAAEAALKGSISEAAKEAYHALKAKIGKWASADLDHLEEQPEAMGCRATLAEKIDEHEDDKTEAHALAGKLLEALSAAEGAAALDVERLRAQNVDLGNIKSIVGATGVRFRDAHLKGDFRTGDIEVDPKK
jgi:hypothetical protein